MQNVFDVPDGQTGQHQRKQRAYEGHQNHVGFVKVENPEQKHENRENVASQMVSRELSYHIPRQTQAHARREHGEQNTRAQKRQVVAVVMVTDAATRVNTMMVTLQYTDVTELAVVRSRRGVGLTSITI